MKVHTTSEHVIQYGMAGRTREGAYLQVLLASLLQLVNGEGRSSIADNLGVVRKQTSLETLPVCGYATRVQYTHM